MDTRKRTLILVGMVLGWSLSYGLRLYPLSRWILLIGLVIVVVYLIVQSISQHHQGW